MHIESVALQGFRGMNVEVPLTGPLAVVVGPNNSGKSAIVDAIRSVLVPHAGRMGQRWIQESDFTEGADAVDELEIVITFGDVPDSERGRLITLLTPRLGVGKAKITLKAVRSSDGRIVSRLFGGDFAQNEVEAIAREALQFVYLPALRDALGDLKPGPANKLPALVGAFAPPGHPDRDTLLAIAQAANDQLEVVPAIANSSSAIQDRLSGMTGKGAFSYLSALRFTPSDYDRIVATLQALAGADSVTHLQQSGLGYNNLVYIAVVLAALQHETDAALSVLLVEEPEAHLHPQLQSLLMQYLEKLTLEDAQVIATTHSPQFASSAQVERITAIARSRGASATAHALHRASLDPKQFRFLRRFLDVTKSSLLFAEGVLLVEGIAEQLLLPAIARTMDISLADYGVAIVNIEGVAFKPFIGLFSSDGLPTRCAVISDSDPYIGDDGAAHARSPRAEGLIGASDGQVVVYLAETTLEWDLAYTNAAAPEGLLDALARTHPILAVGVRQIFESGVEPREFADAFYKTIEDSKGVFAQELVETLMDGQFPFVVPEYLSRSIRWVTQR